MLQNFKLFTVNIVESKFFSFLSWKYRIQIQNNRQTGFGYRIALKIISWLPDIRLYISVGPDTEYKKYILSVNGFAALPDSPAGSALYGPGAAAGLPGTGTSGTGSHVRTVWEGVVD